MHVLTTPPFYHNVTPSGLDELYGEYFEKCFREKPGVLLVKRRPDQKIVESLVLPNKGRWMKGDRWTKSLMSKIYRFVEKNPSPFGYSMLTLTFNSKWELSTGNYTEDLKLMCQKLKKEWNRFLVSFKRLLKDWMLLLNGLPMRFFQVMELTSRGVPHLHLMIPHLNWNHIYSLYNKRLNGKPYLDFYEETKRLWGANANWSQPKSWHTAKSAANYLVKYASKQVGFNPIQKGLLRTTRIRIFSYSRGSLQTTETVPYNTTFPEYQWTYDCSIPGTAWVVHFAGPWTKYYDSLGSVNSDIGCSGIHPDAFTRDEYHEYLVWKSRFEKRKVSEWLTHPDLSTDQDVNILQIDQLADLHGTSSDLNDLPIS